MPGMHATVVKWRRQVGSSSPRQELPRWLDALTSCEWAGLHVRFNEPRGMVRESVEPRASRAVAVELLWDTLGQPGIYLA